MRLILEPGQITELRVLEAASRNEGRPHIESGYFDDPDKLALAAATIKSAKGFYFLPNPVLPSLLSRAHNRIRAVGKEPTTADHDVIRRRWLLIDFDAVRPSGISSTDAEHAGAIERAHVVQAHLRDAGWAEPILADSGNGAHLMYRIDVPADDHGLVQRCLEGLAGRFDDAAVTLDRKVYNPARIWKLYGTPAGKGDNTPDRPHRLARIIQAPAVLTMVPADLLESLASLTVKTSMSASTRSTPKPTGGSFDLEDWIARNGLAVRGPEAWKDGRRWVFDECPWNSDHTNGSAFIVQLGSGAISAGCHHNGCAENDWHRLRDRFELGGRDKPGNKHAQIHEPARTEKSDGSWPEPQPLPAELPPVMPFNADLLPHAFRDWIVDIGQRVQCPPDFPAVGAMVALAGVVGRKVGIRPKRRDDWTVAPNIWGAVVGRPGIMKTPALKEPLRPLHRLEIEAAERFKDASHQHAAKKLVAELTRKSKQGDITKAIRHNGDALGIATSMLDCDQADPVRQRYIVNDSTVEKLGELLNQNPNGVTCYRDELIGLLRSLDKEGQEGARAFYLEAWDGTGRYTYDRIGRGTLDIEAAIVSVIGGIQPGPLAEYVRGAVGNGAGSDGLLQRFQLMVYPDVVREWVNVDRWPDTMAKNHADETFKRLNSLDPLTIGAERDEDDPNSIPFLRFAEDAQDVFDGWRANLEQKIRSGNEHPAIESHLAKYRSLIPSLSLLIHLADNGKGPVTLESLKRAIKWGEYLETHARRIYATAINPDSTAAKALAHRIVAGDVKDGFALRDVYNNGWSSLSTRDDAAGAAAILSDLDWLAEASEPTPGRTRTRYWINPRALRTHRQ